jgi:predicted dehydrogenase
VHRLGVFSGRRLDVDVIFDLMIHDLDILLSFVPAEVEQVHAVGIPILSPKVDIASVRLEFANGCVANLTASRVSTDKVRKLRFFQPNAYVSIDYGRRDALVVSIDKKATAAASGGGFPAGLGFRKLETKPEEPLHAELRAFVEAVRSRQPGPVTGREARRALALAERVATGIAEHARKLPASVTTTGTAR